MNRSFARFTLCLMFGLLTACEGGLLGAWGEPTPKTTGENYIALNGHPLPAGVPVDYEPPVAAPTPVTVGPDPVQVAPAQPAHPDLPADSVQYLIDRQAALKDYEQVAPAGFVEPVARFEDGYPVFRATCIFGPTESECTLGHGEVVDEAYLSAHLPLVRNADVLRTDWACGEICVDEDGHVVGKVSPEMRAWREQHCTWVQYGLPNCN